MNEKPAPPAAHRNTSFGPVPPLKAAYPIGDHDQLLKAVLLQNHDHALKMAFQWLDDNDIDIVTFREHRLLIALLARFGKTLDQHRFYPRIVGLQRMLWTRKLLFLNDVRPALTAITDKGVEILLIKGASRLVDGRVGKSGRVAHDLDLVVHPSDARTTFQILANDGWIASSGWSSARIAHQIETQRALNLYKGRFGDIDLHLYPFHPHQGHRRDDERFWADATRTKLDRIPVCVPSPAQQVAIAIAHGGLDSHTHSDWLCDIADLLCAGTINADELETIIEARGVEASAAIALHYLADECALPVERAMLDRLTRRAAAKPLRYLSQFLQTRPRDREGKLGRIMRGVAKQVRMRAARKALPKPMNKNRIALRGRPRSSDKPGNKPVLLQYHDSIEAIDGRLRLEVRIDISAPARRPCDFELFADDQFIGHASWRANLYRDAILNLTFEFEKPAGARTLALTARPRRADRLIKTEADTKRYAAVPFRILDFSIEPR